MLIKPKLLLELSASAWWFGDNDDYLLGKKEQDPIYALDATGVITRIGNDFNQFLMSDQLLL